jgi:hypothetical protein
MMTELELREHRRRKWRLDGPPLRTAAEACDFLESVGFCLMYPGKPAALAPTFIGACAGSEQSLPTRAQAFADLRARAAEELALELLRQRAAFEVHLPGEALLLVAASVFPYFYALLGQRNPKVGPKAAGEKISPLAGDVWAELERSGPLGEGKLRQALGGALSESALERALGDLAASLRIARVDTSPQAGSTWDLLARWAPQPVKEGIALSVAESLSALVSRYLDCVVAAEAKDVEEFFSPLAPRSRVRESVNALLGARQLAFLPVGHKTLLHIAPEHPPVTFRRVVPAGARGKPKAVPRRRPAARRRDGKP